MSSRVDTHVIETESKNIFSAAMTRYSDDKLKKGDLLFREITERDYGIDGQVELFVQGEATGRIAMIQLKGTEKRIEKLKTADAVSCYGISKSNLSYCRQNNIPVILVYCSTTTGDFYYIDLQSIYKDKIPSIGDSQFGTVRIPIINHSDNLRKLVDIINSYYDVRESESKIQGSREIESGDCDPFAQVNTYVFKHNQKPSDGEHKEIGEHNDIISIGLWENGTLVSGTEYDWLIRVVDGKLIYKPDNQDDPYDATDGFKYEKLEQWGWRITIPFSLSGVYIENEAIERFYVVDMEVDHNLEQMINIRTLKDFLKDKGYSYDQYQ